MIPRVKVNYGWVDLFRAVFARGRGDAHAALRNWLAAYQGSRHILLTPSGRAGLYLLLRATPRCRVILPAYTCKAVVEAARMADKEIRFLDCEPVGFNAALDDLERVADPGAIFVATHQFGIPCDIARAVAICRSCGALVIEDCAAALGTRIGGQLAGSFGDAAFFSFDSTKLINVPLKAGFVTVQSPEWFTATRDVSTREFAPMPHLHQLRLLILGAAYLVLENPVCYRLFHGLTLRKRFTADSSEISLERTAFYRYGVPHWQAWLALRQLERLEQTLARRRELHTAYQRGLAGSHRLQLPPKDTRGEWSCIRFPVLTADDKLAWYRAANRRGVDFAFSFTFLGCPEAFVRAHAIARSILDLPFYPKLTDAETRKVISVLRELDTSFTAQPPPRITMTNIRQMLRDRRNREEVYSRPEYWNGKTQAHVGDAISMWPNNNLNRLYHREMLALLDEELPDVRGLQILDLGCGTGRIARCFAARGACVTGVDFADKAIAIARTLSPGDNPRYEVGSMFALQGESLYDLIVSWGSIVFACRDAAQLRTVASSLRRLIRPGGRLLLLEPAHRGFVHRVLNLDQREFGEILKESGFDEIRVRQMHFWPVRFALAFVSWPNWITVPIYRLGQAVMNLSRNRWGGDYKAIFAVRT